MSGDPGQALGQTGDGQPGEPPAHAWRVDVAGQRPAYLWPRKDGICGAAPDGAIGCGPTTALQKKGALVYIRSKLRRSDFKYEYAHIFGIATDGVDSVQFHFKGGSDSTAPVKSNVFYAELDDLPEEVSWEDSNGRHTQPTGAISPKDLKGIPAP